MMLCCVVALMMLCCCILLMLCCLDVVLLYCIDVVLLYYIVVWLCCCILMMLCGYVVLMMLFCSVAWCCCVVVLILLCVHREERGSGLQISRQTRPLFPGCMDSATANRLTSSSTFVFICPLTLYIIVPFVIWIKILFWTVSYLWFFLKSLFFMEFPGIIYYC